MQTKIKPGPRPKPILDRLFRYIKKTDTCWEWIGAKNYNGYGVLRVYGRNLMAHRLMWIEHNGPIPEDMCACHRCNNPSCVNPNHMFLGTHSENMKDAYKKGRKGTSWKFIKSSAKGEQHWNCKLDDQKVMEIRELSPILSTKVLAARFGVTPKSIQNIVARRTWRHV